MQLSRSLIENTENIKYISAVTAWELAIKSGLGKLRLNQSAGDFYNKYVEQNGFEIMLLSLNHLFAAENLPLHHKDPFDRLLIGQAQIEKLTIVSADSALDAYDIERVW